LRLEPDLRLETTSLTSNACVYNSGRVVHASVSGQCCRFPTEVSCKRPLCPGQLAFLSRLVLGTAALPRNARIYNASRVGNARSSGQFRRWQHQSSCTRLLCPEQLAFRTHLALDTAALTRNARVYDSSRVVNDSPSGQRRRLQLKSSCKRLLCPEGLPF
jgi:hypothetical protein